MFPSSSSFDLHLLQAPGGGGDFMSMLPMLAIFIAIFYFILIRPQQRERKKQEAMRTDLKKGDEVLTQSGVVAKIWQVKDQYIVLDLDGSAKMKVVKDAIVRRLGDQPESAKDKSTAKEEKDAAAS